MDLFGGYGSDSDSDSPKEDIHQSVSTQPKPQAQAYSKQPAVFRGVTSAAASSSSTSSTAVGQQKKVKRLDISFLPPEIQAALARGDSTRDSDDDEPGPVIQKSNVSKSINKPLDETSCKLLGMLPAPKGHEMESTGISTGKAVTNNIAKATPMVPASVTTKETTTTAKPAASKSAFNFSYSSTETVRTGQGKTGSVSVSVESKPEVPVMPWFQDIQKPIEAVSEVYT